jgi:hypothetical protein
LLNANGKFDLKLNGDTFVAGARRCAQKISTDIHHAGLVEGTK